MQSANVNEQDANAWHFNLKGREKKKYLNLTSNVRFCLCLLFSTISGTMRCLAIFWHREMHFWACNKCCWVMTHWASCCVCQRLINWMFYSLIILSQHMPLVIHFECVWKCARKFSLSVQQNFLFCSHRDYAVMDFRNLRKCELDTIHMPNRVVFENWL